VGLFESKIVINIWCKNTFDNSDDFLLKFSSVFNARSSIIKHQPLTPILQQSNISSQSSVTNLPQFKINSKVRFLPTHTIYLNKLLLRSIRRRQEFVNSKYECLPNNGKLMNFGQNMRFLTIFAGEGG